MAEVAYTTTARLSLDEIWDFVRDMDNWAPFVAGYQQHEKQSEDDSVWVLKGDVGHLTRTLRFQVHVVEWAGPHRVRFELKGLNEQMNGRGLFEMALYEDADAAVTVVEAPRRGWLGRLLDRIARFFFRRRFGEARRWQDAGAGPGEGMVSMSFTLSLEPGGPMAPMINAMMKPAMTAAAEDLANRIVGELEGRRAGASA